jgi:hypothetical protein
LMDPVKTASAVISAKIDAPNPSSRWASGDEPVTPSRVCGQAVQPENASIIAFTSPSG